MKRIRPIDPNLRRQEAVCRLRLSREECMALWALANIKNYTMPMELLRQYPMFRLQDKGLVRVSIDEDVLTLEEVSDYDETRPFMEVYCLTQKGVQAVYDLEFIDERAECRRKLGEMLLESMGR